MVRQQLCIYADVPERAKKALVDKKEMLKFVNEYLKSKGKKPLTSKEKKRYMA